MDRTRARRRGQEVLGIAIFLLGLGVAATIAVHLIPLEDGSTASNVAALVLLGIPFALVAEIVLFNNSLADVVAWLGFMSIVDLVAQTGGSRERYGPVLLHILSAGPSNGMHQRRPPFVVGIVLCAALLVSVWLGHGVNISGFGPRVAQPAHSRKLRCVRSNTHRSAKFCR